MMIVALCRLVDQRVVLPSVVSGVNDAGVLILSEQVCAHFEPLMKSHVKVVCVLIFHRIATSVCSAVRLNRLSHLSSHHQVSLREEAGLFVT